MEKITEKNCIETIRELFPRFERYWEAYSKMWSLTQAIHLKMVSFANYLLEILMERDETEMRRHLNFVEYMLQYGTDEVRHSVMTVVFDLVLSKDPEEINLDEILPFMGEQTAKSIVKRRRMLNEDKEKVETVVKV